MGALEAGLPVPADFPPVLAPTDGPNPPHDELIPHDVSHLAPNNGEKG